MLVFLHLSRLEHGSGITQIPNAPKTFSFTLMNSCWLNSSPFPKYSQITSNSNNVLLVHKLLKNIMQLPEKCKTQFGRKINCLLLLTNDMHIQEKIKLHHNRPNSLANAAHAASEFRKQRLTFLSINIITKYFALPCKVQKNNEKYIIPRCYSTILQQIQSCAQRRQCCNQIPHAISSYQGNVAHVHRINGSLYFHTKRFPIQQKKMRA